MTALSGSPTFTLVSGSWHRFQATLAFDDGTDVFTITSLSVDNYGSMGTSFVSNLGTLASATVDVSSGPVASLLKDDGTAHLIAIGSQGRGTQYLDNLTVTAVPEPSSALLVVLGSALFLRSRRRR